MHTKLDKIRKENPNFDKKLVNMFAKSMPKLLSILIDGEDYNKHIGSKEVAEMAAEYITDNKGEHIGFKWDLESVMSYVKNYIDIDSVDFYTYDIWVWANVKYGDMQHITSDTSTIIKYTIAELTDPDYPFYDASHRAYCWLKKHIEIDEN